MPVLNAMSKIRLRHEVAPTARRQHDRGAKLVFTNGCFDLLHPGHVKTFEFARSLGDCLFVGVNSDASVRRLKGEGRPIQDETERAFMVAALEVVDYVTIFDEDTPEELIRSVRPGVLVKGEDWKGKEIAGAKFVESYGGRVEFAPAVAGVSTTGIIEKILRGNDRPVV